MSGEGREGGRVTMFDVPAYFFEVFFLKFFLYTLFKMRSRGARVPATVVLLHEVYTDTRGACGGSYGHDIYSPLVFDGCIKKRGMQQYKILIDSHLRVCL